MVTFAQAQERAEEWVNGDVPAYQHREVRVREFGLGFVVWAEDRVDGPRSDGGAQRLVIARDSGDATLWPALPVGEVIRRYEEEYGRAEDEVADAAPAPAARVDLNQTSFLLSPPEWLQEAADKLGIPDRRGEGARAASGAASGEGSLPQTQAGVPGSRAGAPEVPGAGSGAGVSWPVAGGEEGTGASSGAPGGSAGATPWAGTDTNGDFGEDRSVPLPATVFAPPVGDGDDRMQDAKTEMISGGSRLPSTAVTPAFDPSLPPGAPGAPGAPATYGYPQGAPAGAAPVPGGTPPPGAVSYGYPQGQPPAPGTPAPGVPGPAPVPGATPPPAPGSAVYGYPQAPGAQGAPAVPPPGAPQGAPAPAAPGAPERPLAPNAGDIADAATSKAAPPRRARGSAEPPHPPGVPGAPGARPGAVPPPAPPVPGAPGAGAGAYVPTQLVSALGPDGPQGPGAPQPPAPPAAPNVPGGTPPGGVGDAHHAATMLAGPGLPGPGAPQPPGVPGAPFAPNPPGAPGGPASAGGPQGAVHHAETVLSAPPVGAPAAFPPPPAPGVPGAPGAPAGVPQPMPPGAFPPGAVPPGAVPSGPPMPPPGAQPTVGPGYQAVLRYRAHDGSEQQLIRRSAPGTPHPEWQIFHELRGMNVPPGQVLELHTELESCELPGAYCARMIREQWPQARIASIAPYGTDHASRQQGMQQLLAHQGELHQVADGPARPAPVRAPLPPVQPAPPIPPEAIAQELAAAFGPGVFRFEQAAVSRQGVPPVVAHTLVVAGLPADMGPFFWAQAQPGRPVPTLAELAQERGVRPAPDAGSYLVMGSDFGKAICVQYGTANIVAVPVEAGPGGGSVPPQFVNTGLPEFARCLALLGRMWRLRFGLNQEQAGRWTVDFQTQLASLDPAALGSPESWWSVLLEQMWDGLL
ncbi:SUKH-4 family immunity protein [Streptomyces adustus]|uniref:SUKH-4 family immunity protein n=1 Tax=Streptomyces adustus TaxID=1609272 RepID=UPI00371EEE85